MPTFKHFGKLGDIIFSLPSVERLGGGVIYLNPWPFLDANAVNSIIPLLKNQDYIEDVRIYNGEDVDYDLNSYLFPKFLIETRQIGTPPMTIVDYMLLSFGLKGIDHSKRWVKPVPPIHLGDRDIAVHLSPRYLNDRVVWGDILRPVADRVFFVGLRSEWVDFCRYSGMKLPYVPTNDFLELQGILEGATRMYCGAGGPHALAEAIKMPISLAIADSHDCLFERDGVEYILSYD
jgi:hypothetical protein